MGAPSDIDSTNVSWQFTLLGQLRGLDAGRSMSAPPARTHALLASLLLTPQRQTRERVVGLLFPGVSERTGRRRLSDQIWVLREAFPGLPLAAARDWIEIPADARWLDVEAFKERAAGVDLADWQAALRLYGGDLLPGCYDDWLLVERESLHLTYLQLLFRTGDRLFQLGHYRKALSAAQRLVRAEPLDERAVRLVMRIHAELGERGAALAAYEHLVALAADKLHTEPAATTQALAAAIRAPEPRPRDFTAADLEGNIESLCGQAQSALGRGDWGQIERCIAALRSSEAGDSARATLLEADLARLRGANEKAEELLQACGDRRASVLARQAAVALALRQRTVAHQAATRALLMAHEERDLESSLEALLALAEARRQMGQTAQAMATADRALELARSLPSPAGMVRALLIQGKTMFRQGRSRDAISIFRRAQSLALEGGLRPWLAEAWHRLAYARMDVGVYLDVLPQIESALSIWRDLGLRHAEARTLQTLASLYDVLGRHEESMRTIKRARAIYESLDDEFGVARCTYHLAANILYRDESLLDEAVDLAREAITVFRSYDAPGWEASTQGILGLCLLLDGAYSAALAPLREACQKHEVLGEVGYLAASLAHQGLVHLGLDDPQRALDCTERALLALAQGVLDSDVASEVYYAHAMVLDALGQGDHAREHLIRAYENLIQHAEQLDDEPARRAFFARDPMVRRLMEEVRTRGIAPDADARVVTRWLPCRPVNGYGSGRHGMVPVTWTIDAGPADAALKRSQGAIALRHSRLVRIWSEAGQQGARPTVENLADALGVSPRTIKRDLAALREEGRIP